MSNISNSEEDRISFVEDIQQMMYTFGDCEHASKDSAVLVEDIVKRFIGQLIFKFGEITEACNCKLVKTETVLFYYRNNKSRLNRCLQFIDLKKYQRLKIAETDADDSPLFDDDPVANFDSKNLNSSIEFLRWLDPAGNIKLDVNGSYNDLYLQKLERRTRDMATSKYVSFSKARKRCFAAPNGASDKLVKFKSWIAPFLQQSDAKFSFIAMEMLAFLAYEAVKEIVDLVLISRSTANSHLVDPISTDEIKEVIRRLTMPTRSMAMEYPILLEL